MARGARHDPGRDDVIGDRPSPAPRLAGPPCSSPVEPVQASDQALDFKTSGPASSCARSCDPRQKEHTTDTAVTPDAALTARADGNTYPTPRAPD